MPRCKICKTYYTEGGRANPAEDCECGYNATQHHLDMMTRDQIMEAHDRWSQTQAEKQEHDDE